MSIKSFVFLDSETTGLPAYEHNKTKITELCLISAQAEHISLGVIPRVQNKLTLCFNPQKRIQPGSEEITGLYNDELANESSFNEISLNILTNFLERLNKPICLVAHNGYRFDYPILRNHIESVNKKFPEDILCIDTLRAFREILKNQKTNETDNAVKEKTKEGEHSKTIELAELTDDWDDILCNVAAQIEDSLCATPPKNNFQTMNETTPPVKKHCNVPAAPKHRRIRNSADSASSSSSGTSTAQRRLDFGQNKPKPGFKLGEVYERLTGKPPTNAHQAEEDVKMLLECAVQLGDSFIEYANINAIPLITIPKMTPGVKIGDILP